MGKVRCRDPRTGVVYVYSSEGYFDEKDQKYKYRRRVIGKLDENGNEIPTGPKGRPRKTGVTFSGSATQTGDAAYQAALARIRELEEKNLDLQNELSAKTDSLLKFQKDVNRSIRQLTEALDALNKAVGRLS